MKRMLSILLVVMLLAGFALAEGTYTVDEYVASQGYKAETAKNKSGAVICDYLEPAKGAHTLVWSDSKNVYTVTASRNREKLKALYADLVSYYSWDSCTYTVGEEVQYAFNAPDITAAKTYKTQTNYAKAIVKYVYPDGAAEVAPSTGSSQSGKQQSYVVNSSTKKFHLPDCVDVAKMKKENRQNVRSTRDQLIADGYDPCQHCNP